MGKSKIERKKKILEKRKKSEDELISKRKRIKGEEDSKLVSGGKKRLDIPDEIIGLIVFLLLPNVIIPFVSFVYSIIIFIILFTSNDILLFWYLYAILMYLIIATLTGLTCYGLYKLNKVSYYISLGLCFFNLAINTSLFFTLNLFIIIIALIIVGLNCIDLYFLLAYKEIRDALNIPTY